MIRGLYGIMRSYDIWGSYLISDPYGKFFGGPLTKNSERVIIIHLRPQGFIRFLKYFSHKISKEIHKISKEIHKILKELLSYNTIVIQSTTIKLCYYEDFLTIYIHN